VRLELASQAGLVKGFERLFQGQFRGAQMPGDAVLGSDFAFALHDFEQVLFV